MTASLPVSATPGTPPIGLRERKKIRTRQAIRRAAYRLFAERGYDATRIDQIAEAAEVSPSTVFRYFASKEDIVLTDEDDAVMEAALRARPPDEPPLTAIRAALTETMRRLYGTPEARAEAEQRMRLIATVPALRARMHENLAATGEFLARALADRTGRPVDGLELRVFVGAVLGGFQEALLYWSARGMRDDLTRIVDRALDVLENGLA
ncbi:TetR/AcrR family transcriptional regulator [Streptomyces litchfieldiae]|uniref:TetR family transcriptional regulator n=1 Tax=Streptomyces litchfieldiae TaxID=3075543 RepID=A0ABU2MIS5_9ACTN|nr:TetR family transcriptional regulator [Streptomyces sp. DSM 44938]MDT0341486.1 TetR family transcriptional regulator [Streptomyces sp. DSM 44938]